MTNEIAKEWHEQGKNYFRNAEYEKALECVNKELEIDHNNPIIWHNKGCCLNKLQKYEESIDCLNKAIELNPTSALFWDNKAFCLSRLYKSDVNEMKECLDTAKKLRKMQIKKKSK